MSEFGFWKKSEAKENVTGSRWVDRWPSLIWRLFNFIMFQCVCMEPHYDWVPVLSSMFVFGSFSMSKVNESFPFHLKQPFTINSNLLKSNGSPNQSEWKMTWDQISHQPFQTSWSPNQTALPFVFFIHLATTAACSTRPWSSWIWRKAVSWRTLQWPGLDCCWKAWANMLGLSWEPFNAARLNRKRAIHQQKWNCASHVSVCGVAEIPVCPEGGAAPKAEAPAFGNSLISVIIDTMLSQNEGEPKNTVVSWWCFMQFQYGNPLMFIITPALGPSFRRQRHHQRPPQHRPKHRPAHRRGHRRSHQRRHRRKPPKRRRCLERYWHHWHQWHQCQHWHQTSKLANKQQVIQQEEASHWVFGMKLPDASEAAEPISFQLFNDLPLAGQKSKTKCLLQCWPEQTNENRMGTATQTTTLYAIKQNLQDFCCSNLNLKGFWHAWVTTFVTLRNVSRPYVVRMKTVMAQIPSACTRACEACEQLATILTSTSIQTIHPFFLAFTKRIQHALRAFCPMIIHL